MRLQRKRRGYATDRSAQHCLVASYSDTVHVNDGYRYMEQGIHEFTYKLIPHNGDWRDGNIAAIREYLMKPVVFLTNNHTGALPEKNSFITLSGEGVSISAAKISEDGKAWVLRCAELNGKEPQRGLRSAH